MLIKRSSAAFVATCMSPIDGIAVETIFILLAVPTLTIAAIGTPIAGALLLLGYALLRHKQITIFSKAWKQLLLVAVFFAITEFAWYDAVSHIGAGKTALINLPLEIVCILVLAWFFLYERLGRLQLLGACITIVGTVTVIASDLTMLNNTVQFGIGEIEAIIASLSTGIEIVLVAKLLTRYNTIEVTAATLLVAGLMLNVQWLFLPIPLVIGIVPTVLPSLILFSLIPLTLFLMQYLSMKRIGVSLTSIITSSSIIITLVLQLILIQLVGMPMTVPTNVPLAMAGGLVSVLGMVMVFRYEIK